MNINKNRLSDAVMTKDVNEVKKALEDSEVNEQDMLGWTALHYAAFLCQGEIIDVLVEAGGDLDRKDNYGITPRDRMNVKRETNHSLGR